MKIADHAECGAVDVPWQGALPAGNYNLVVSVDGQVVAQIGMSLDGTSVLRVVDVTPRKP